MWKECMKIFSHNVLKVVKILDLNNGKGKNLTTFG